MSGSKSPKGDRQSLRTVTDHFGAKWAVAEVRDTAHSFPVLWGYPDGEVPGRGCSARAQAILTSPLAAHLEKHRRSNRATINLPVSRNVLRRLRTMLGYHRIADAHIWRNEQIDDLRNLTVQAFATKHGVSLSAAAQARLAVLGKTNRDDNWWKREPARSLLLSDRPASEVAEKLAVKKSVVYKYRVYLRLERDASTRS